MHSNGFSLVRKIFDIDANPDVLHTAPAEMCIRDRFRPYRYVTMLQTCLVWDKAKEKSLIS